VIGAAGGGLTSTVIIDLPENNKKNSMPPEELTRHLRQRAHCLGFDLVGACPAVAPASFSRLQNWLGAGLAGRMDYLARRLDAYRDPASVLPAARSILMLGMHYRTASPQEAAAGYGRVSRYAWGAADYHDVIHAKLTELREFLWQQVPAAAARGVVDTAPLLEREFGRLAGLGWIGKNTMLINRQSGSWFFLAALLTDQELAYDLPQATDHCGTCRACLDACPTGAFPEPYVLDATRCISYLTIELREPIPESLRPGLGEWLFGCDVCQEVCPWNRRAPLSGEPSFEPVAGMNPAELAGLFTLTDPAFRERFRGTPLWRAGRRGVLRSAAIVLGNQRALTAVDSLALGMNDVEPQVREACAWALGRFDTPAAQQTLQARWEVETDPRVRVRLAAELARLAEQGPDQVMP
jgi:epoxyqueuosine reductase